jgi:GMP synthase (glutamine-hydrolysing)
MHRILLLQARDHGDPMLEHELSCFVDVVGIPRDRFVPLNMAHVPSGDWPELPTFDAVMVGGSGDYSVVKGGFDWHRPMLDYVLEAVSHDLPFFGSCFGFQALVQALGGELVSDPTMAEVGTFEATLTPEGKSDRFFGHLPETFDAQFGHNDSAVTLPDELVHLVSTERCAYQAVRMRGRPVWATQFHPELDEQANMTRYVRYLVNYADRPMGEEEAWATARTMHRPSPHANALLSRFVEAVDAHLIGD